MEAEKARLLPILRIAESETRASHDQKQAEGTRVLSTGQAFGFRLGAPGPGPGLRFLSGPMRKDPQECFAVIPVGGEMLLLSQFAVLLALGAMVFAPARAGFPMRLLALFSAESLTAHPRVEEPLTVGAFPDSGPQFLPVEREGGTQGREGGFYLPDARQYPLCIFGKIADHPISRRVDYAVLDAEAVISAQDDQLQRQRATRVLFGVGIQPIGYRLPWLLAWVSAWSM